MPLPTPSAWFAALTTVLAASAAATAAPQGPPPAPAGEAAAEIPDEARHAGIFLRFTLGATYLSSSGTATSGITGTLTTSGFGPSLGVQLGGTVAPRLQLFGEFVLDVASSPSVTFNGQSGTADNTDYTHGAFGVGLNYYLMPHNCYLSGSALLGRLNISHNSGSGGGSTSSSANSAWGAAAKLQLGKEWWVSEKWGLGAAALAMVGSNGAGDSTNTTLLTWSAAVVFSATYN